jgi:manganese transport protein
MRLGRLSSLALGVLAGIGGFVDMGGVITSSQAGAQYRYALLWTLVPGVIGFAVYADMAGRVSIASGQTLFDVLRDRLGVRLALFPLLANTIVNTATLMVELCGMALALQLALKISYLLFLPLVALLLFLILWRVGFDLLDNAAALIGLTMLVAVAATVKLGPPWGHVGLETLHPAMSTAKPLPSYLFAAIGLLGAYMTPYQFDFYSSGAIEDEWTGADLLTNRIVAVVGTSFGGIVTLGLMVSAALVLFPQHATVQTLADAAKPVQSSFGAIGLLLFIVGVFGVSMGAGLECALSGSYALCQFFGWAWGKHGEPREAPVFHLLYGVLLLLALLIALSGIDPIKVTLLTMIAAAMALPFTFVPLLIVANDDVYMGEQCNTPAINVVAVLILALLVVVMLAAFPLLIISGGG